jgi:hypothetical protein
MERVGIGAYYRAFATDIVQGKFDLSGINQSFCVISPATAREDNLKFVCLSLAPVSDCDVDLVFYRVPFHKDGWVFDFPPIIMQPGLLRKPYFRPPADETNTDENEKGSHGRYLRGPRI